MSESDGIDSISGGTMPKPYSLDLRERVIESIEAGASRREAAELYGISPSIVVIWAQRWKATGSIEAKPSGGGVSPLEEHAEFLLGLVTEQPDLTLDEIVVAMSKAGILGSCTGVWRFYERHDFSFKKNFVRGGAKACRGGPRAATLDARAGHV
jgi:transposase